MKIKVETEWEIRIYSDRIVVCRAIGCTMGAKWDVDKLQCEGHKLPPEVRGAALELLHPLADNEVRSSYNQKVYQLRWSGVEKQCRIGPYWYKFSGFEHEEDNARAAAWFARNKPYTPNACSEYTQPKAGCK